MKHVEALLRTLAERPDGLTSEETAEILGARTAKGIGSRLSEAKTWLRVGGIDWTEVADRRPTHSGLRSLAGLKIERALHTLSAYIENKPSEPVDAPYRGPAIVFRTLRIERSWDVFPHGVIDLPRQVDRSTPGTIHETVVERGEVHIERIENAPADRSAVPAGCGEHGEWVRGLYDDSPRLEPVDLEAMATEQVTVGFGVATVWEKRVALGSDPRGQLAAEQAFPGVDPEDGWHPVPDTPTHRYVRGLVINGRPVKVPPEVALRTCYRLTCMERGNNEERTLEALRGDAEARVTDYIRNEYVQHNRSWFVTYDDYGTIEWPMTPDAAAILLAPPRVREEHEDGTREWTFDDPPRFEDKVVAWACELWTDGEYDRAEPLLRAVLRANPIRPAACGTAHRRVRRDGPGRRRQRWILRCRPHSMGNQSRRYTSGRA